MGVEHDRHHRNEHDQHDRSGASQRLFGFRGCGGQIAGPYCRAQDGPEKNGEATLCCSRGPQEERHNPQGKAKQ